MAEGYYPEEDSSIPVTQESHNGNDTHEEKNEEHQDTHNREDKGEDMKNMKEETDSNASESSKEKKTPKDKTPMSMVNKGWVLSLVSFLLLVGTYLLDSRLAGIGGVTVPNGFLNTWRTNVFSQFTFWTFLITTAGAIWVWLMADTSAKSEKE
jgi:cation transport ATPase